MERLRVSLMEVLRLLGLPWRFYPYFKAHLRHNGPYGDKKSQASLGHQSIRMTERYAKAVASLNRDIAEKTSEIFNLSGSEFSKA